MGGAAVALMSHSKHHAQGREMTRTCQKGRAIRRTIRSGRTERHRRWYLGVVRTGLAQ